MMQMPLLSYPNFSHILQLHHQQQQHHIQQQIASSTRFSRSTVESDTTCSLGSNSSPSPSPTPPPSDSKPCKNFTIDAILGLREDQRNELRGRAFPTVAAFHPHPRLHVPELSITALGVNLPNHSNLHHTTGRESAGIRHQTEKPLSDGSGKKCGGGKSKRVRTIFTPEQLERLEAEFERQQYMVGPERLYLAHTLQLTEAQVKVWFQNRRIKWRKQHLEIQQQRLAILKQQQQQNLPRSDGDESDESGDESANQHYKTSIFNNPPSANYQMSDDNFNSRESLVSNEDFV